MSKRLVDYDSSDDECDNKNNQKPPMNTQSSPNLKVIYKTLLNNPELRKSSIQSEGPEDLSLVGEKTATTSVSQQSVMTNDQHHEIVWGRLNSVKDLTDDQLCLILRALKRYVEVIVPTLRRKLTRAQMELAMCQTNDADPEHEVNLLNILKVIRGLFMFLNAKEEKIKRAKTLIQNLKSKNKAYEVALLREMRIGGKFAEDRLRKQLGNDTVDEMLKVKAAEEDGTNPNDLELPVPLQEGLHIQVGVHQEKNVDPSALNEKEMESHSAPLCGPSSQMKEGIVTDVRKQTYWRPFLPSNASNSSYAREIQRLGPNKRN